MIHDSAFTPDHIPASVGVLVSQDGDKEDNISASDI